MYILTSVFAISNLQIQSWGIEVEWMFENVFYFVLLNFKNIDLSKLAPIMLFFLFLMNANRLAFYLVPYAFTYKLLHNGSALLLFSI